MFPTLRQRLVILLAVVGGAFIWMWAGDYLLAADGGSGFSLTHGGTGPLSASAAVALLGLPTLALGLITAVQGHPLSGVFVVAATLCVVAAQGGPIDGWLWRYADADQLPQRYGLLVLELVIWQAGLVVMLTVIGRLRSPLRTRFAALAFEDHVGHEVKIAWPGRSALIAGLISAVGSGTLCMLLIRDSHGAQVIGGLVLAFVIGAMAAQLIHPQNNPVGILLSPLLVALAAYTWMLLRYDSTQQVLAAWHAGTLPGPALALPIHYASAALAGAAAGIGLAHSFSATQADPAEA